MKATYSTIGNIQIGQYLMANGMRYYRTKNSAHPSLGGVMVFEAPTGERMIFPKSKESQRVLVRDAQTFEI